MSKEKLKTIIFINSPQNSKTPDLPQTDLLGNLSFLSVVRAFDSAWKTEKEGDSLEISRQGASVVYSVGASSAFFDGLRQEICPGLIIPDLPIDVVFAAHSVGENGSEIQGGVTDIPTVAKVLDIREKITENPFDALAKYMVAVLGFDITKSSYALEKINSQSQEGEEVAIANLNTPEEAVFSVQTKGQSEERGFVEKMAGLLEEFKSESAKRLRVIKLPVPNAFHSRFLAAEEALFINAVEPILKNQIGDVTPGTIYSPMLQGWVENRDQAIDVILHQLTRPVNFVKAMKDLTDGSLDIMAIITADVKDITPKMVTNNLGAVKFPILNIKNIQDLDEAIAICAKQYRQV
jgi:malonyl CoA-acyl carrier protein transacylase